MKYETINLCTIYAYNHRIYFWCLKTQKTPNFLSGFLKLNSLLIPNDEIILINKNIVIKGNRKKNLQIF